MSTDNDTGGLRGLALTWLAGLALAAPVALTVAAYALPTYLLAVQLCRVVDVAAPGLLVWSAGYVLARAVVAPTRSSADTEGPDTIEIVVRWAVPLWPAMALLFVADGAWRWW